MAYEWESVVEGADPRSTLAVDDIYLEGGLAYQRHRYIPPSPCRQTKSGEQVIRDSGIDRPECVVCVREIRVTGVSRVPFFFRRKFFEKWFARHCFGPDLRGPVEEGRVVRLLGLSEKKLEGWRLFDHDSPVLAYTSNDLACHVPRMWSLSYWSKLENQHVFIGIAMRMCRHRPMSTRLLAIVMDPLWSSDDNRLSSARARARCDVIRDELMELAWHPSRFVTWCLDVDTTRRLTRA